MTKFLDENNKLKMTSIEAIYRIAVLMILFSSIIDIVTKH